ncbi:MAG: hypothetical protein MRQ13_03560 [Candidatus Midichloria sp.]|nr:hypothetical protein [Candidatus Midichloria sp.]
MGLRFRIFSIISKGCQRKRQSDLIIGAPFATPSSRSGTGQAYVVYAKLWAEQFAPNTIPQLLQQQLSLLQKHLPVQLSPTAAADTEETSKLVPRNQVLQLFPSRVLQQLLHQKLLHHLLQIWH